jgi:hypothetical protein
MVTPLITLVGPSSHRRTATGIHLSTSSFKRIGWNGRLRSYTKLTMPNRVAAVVVFVV